MFSFLKKQNRPLSPLYQDFTEDDVLIALNMIQFGGMCDTDTLDNPKHSMNKEVEFLNYCVKLFNSSAKKANDLLNRIGHLEIIKLFETMDKEKIEKILILILGMFQADGPINETEETFLLRLLDKVNISEEEFAMKLKLAEAFLKSP